MQELCEALPFTQISGLVTKVLTFQADGLEISSPFGYTKRVALVALKLFVGGVMWALELTIPFLCP